MGPAAWLQLRWHAPDAATQNAQMDALPDPVASLFHLAQAAEPNGPGLMFATLYGELHRLARREARRYGPGAVLGTTTLLHEAYLDMSQREALVFPDRARFLSYAGRAMRRLVIDRVRARNACKRGGGVHITSLDTQTADEIEQPEFLQDVGDALDELAALEPELATMVDLKYFCGFSMAEIASLHGVSERTVQRQWEKARVLLFRALGRG
jgi:RNA polymerase sigma factor (TIGR02999 family)